MTLEHASTSVWIEKKKKKKKAFKVKHLNT